MRSDPCNRILSSRKDGVMTPKGEIAPLRHSRHVSSSPLNLRPCTFMYIYVHHRSRAARKRAIKADCLKGELHLLAATVAGVTLVCRYGDVEDALSSGSPNVTVCYRIRVHMTRNLFWNERTPHTSYEKWLSVDFFFYFVFQMLFRRMLIKNSHGRNTQNQW